jgi:two-component system chemotaxis response regulator CheY
MPIRILIVDDSSFARKNLIDIFKEEGFEICGEAGNSEEAIEKYKKLKPDLVTMDIIMPSMREVDGIGAVKEIIKIDPKAKIIMISAMTQNALVVDAIKNGAKDFITKPLEPSRVIETAKRILGTK